MRNVNKSFEMKCPIPQKWGKWKSDLESVSGLEHHQKLIKASNW